MAKVVQVFESLTTVGEFMNFYKYVVQNHDKMSDLYRWLSNSHDYIQNHEEQFLLDHATHVQQAIQVGLLQQLGKFDQQDGILEECARTYHLYQQYKDRLLQIMNNRVDIENSLLLQLPESFRKELSEGYKISLPTIDYHGQTFTVGDTILCPHVLEDGTLFSNGYFVSSMVSQFSDANPDSTKKVKEYEKGLQTSIANMKAQAKDKNGKRIYRIGAIVIDKPQKDNKKSPIPRIVVVDERGSLAKYSMVVAETTGGERATITGELLIQEQDINSGGYVSIDSIKPSTR